jgi:hypothetical protein
VARGWIHTVYKEGVWVVEAEGEGVTSRHPSKEEAAAAGRVTAVLRKTEHLIHNRDGSIAGRNSYGSDPYPPGG